jgi:hypothetical protein
MSGIRILQIVSMLIGIIAFVTGKGSMWELNINDMGDVIAFIVSVGWAFIKLLLTYLTLVLSVGLSIPALIIDLIFDNNLLSSMWSWSWGDIAVDWFWYGTEGIKLFFAFLMSTTIGFLFDESVK